MIDYKVIDLNTYPRIEHLKYFMTMQHPQLNITAEIDVTDLKKFCKQKGYSFFLTFVHIVALSADSIIQFRQRIHKLDTVSDDPMQCMEIREYSQSPTSHTEPTGDELYCYCCLNHHMPFEDYIVMAQKQQQLAREKGSLEEDEEIEAFYFPTCIPWIHYSDIVHPVTDRFDSNPRFSWGKYEQDYCGRLKMPLTVVVHHGLVDGVHLGKFYKNVEENMKALIEGRLKY